MLYLRKILLVLLSQTMVLSILFGCQSKESGSTETGVRVSKRSTEIEFPSPQRLTIDGDFSSITVSKSRGMNEITFNDRESLKTFQAVLSSAVKQEGVVDMASPEYYMEVLYNKEKKESLYVWIGGKWHRSTFMKTEDTHTIYAVSEKETDTLISMVETRLK